MKNFTQTVTVPLSTQRCNGQQQHVRDSLPAVLPFRRSPSRKSKGLFRAPHSKSFLRRANINFFSLFVIRAKDFGAEEELLVVYVRKTWENAWIGKRGVWRGWTGSRPGVGRGSNVLRPSSFGATVTGITPRSTRLVYRTTTKCILTFTF